MLLLVKYFSKNNTILKQAVNNSWVDHNVLFNLINSHYLNEDWLNLLSNICHQSETNIEQEEIDKTLQYIKNEKLKNNDKFKDSSVDYESIILSKFKTDN